MSTNKYFDIRAVLKALITLSQSNQGMLISIKQELE